MDVNSRDPLQNIIPFRIKGAEIGRFDSSGNLKIGTTTTTAPTVRLDISGGSARVNSGSATATALTTTGRIGVNTTTPTVDLDVSGVARMAASSAASTALTTTGRIGVNMLTPTVTLDVSGAARMAALSATSTALTTVGRIGVNTTTPAGALDVTGATYLNSGSGSGSVALWTLGRVGVNNTAPGFDLDVNGRACVTASSATSTALTTTGWIGVNISAPQFDLDVNGRACVTASSATATAFTTTGRIGVNTATPTAALDVSGAAQLTASSSTATALTTTGRIGVNMPTPTADLDVSGVSRLTASSATATALTTTGRIGINVAAPTADLDVSGVSRLTASSATATALTTTGRIGVNTATPTVDLDVLGVANVSNYLSVGSGSSSGVTTTSNIPDKFFVRTGGSNWRDFIPLLVANSTTNIIIWGLDSQWYIIGGNEIAQQYSYFAAYWLNANRAVVGTQFTVESFAGSPPATRGIFTFTATAVSNGIVTAYTGFLSQGGFGTQQLTPQQDGIDAGVARRSLSNRTLLMGGSVETGYLGVSGTARVSASTETATALTITGRIGIGTAAPTCPLHVATVGVNQNVNPNLNAAYFNNSAGSGVYPSVYEAPVSIISAGTLWVQGQHVWVSSDNRIKKNIVQLNSDRMMNIIRKIRPVSFNFINPAKNGSQTMFGFIAQDVKEHLPESIHYNIDVIPNNLMRGQIDNTSTITAASFTLKPDDGDISLNYVLLTTDSSLNFDTQNQYSSTNIYKFKIACWHEWSNEQDIFIHSEYRETNNKYTYVIGVKQEAYDILLKEPCIFVYGQYVYDLHILEHDTVWTVSTAALQEVDRQQQADKARIAELEATVASQQSLIHDILERLNKNGL